MKKSARRARPQAHQRAVNRHRVVQSQRKTHQARIWPGQDLETLRTEATMHAYLGDFDRAYALMDDLHRRFPTYPNYRPELGYIRYIEGDFSPETFRLLRGGRDGRPKVHGIEAFTRAKVPLWDGQPLTPGKRLLVWGWSGFGYGDVIQNYRLVPTAKAQSGAHLTLGCPPGLSRLFQGLPGVDAWVESPLATVADFDYHLPAEWLAVVCPLTAEILQGCPYLSPEPALVEQWRPTFADQNVCHLGLQWLADTAHGNARWRTLTLDYLAPLFDIPHTRWYSLQRGGRKALQAYPQVIDLGEIDSPDARFVHTAAVVSLLDAVVGIDSSLVHLCGAQNHRAYVLLGAIGDPQWGSVSCTESRWYPSVRVRRGRPRPDAPDEQAGLWGDLVGQVWEDLARCVELTLARA